MTSIYQRALGSDFEKLHPMIQQRFGFSSMDGTASIGRGVMERVWHGRPYTLPFLFVGTWRNIMFPAQGHNIPFTVENYAYRDRFGRETVTWLRTFRFRRQVRRFNATMIYSEERDRIVDYLGDHQHLAIDIHAAVDQRGGMHIRSGEQRFYEGPLGFRFPLFFSGIADVHEWYDEDAMLFRISVNVINETWGPLFGYTGSFRVKYVPTERHDIPLHAIPIRHERRE